MAIFNLGVFNRAIFGYTFESEENVSPTIPGLPTVYVDLNNELDFSWVKSIDLDVGQVISYQYQLHKFEGNDLIFVASELLTEPTEYENLILFHYGVYAYIGTYRFRVRSYDGQAYSDWSEVYFDVENVAPTAPSDLIVVIDAVGANSVFIWNPSVDPNVPEEQEIIYLYEFYKIENGEETLIQSGMWNAGDLTSMEDDTVSATLNNEISGTFKFKMRAYDGVAYSGWVTFPAFHLRQGISENTVIVVSPILSQEFQVKFFEKSTQTNWERVKQAYDDYIKLITRN